MKQIVFADSGFEIATKKTPKRTFLEEMKAIVLWAMLFGNIHCYARMADFGRVRVSTETMLRIEFL